MEFYKKTMETLRESAMVDELTLEQELTSTFMTYIAEDLPDEPTLITCESSSNSRGHYKVNAYSFSEENGTLDLFITKLYDSEVVPTLYKTDIENCHNLLYRFFMRCIESKEMYEEYKNIDPDVAEVIELINNQYNQNKLTQIRFYILSNGAKARERLLDIVPITDKNILLDEIVVDINMIENLDISQGASYNDINFKEEFNTPIKCIKLGDGNPDVDCYIAIMPASILARIYDKYKTRLLDRNVRGFLGKKDINKGMEATLKSEGDLFFSYNNGISSISSGIEVREENGVTYIDRIINWQIVNGGQTTNTIYNAFCENVQLDRVNVMMKISVIKSDNENQEDIIANIANYANTQNKVDTADLSSNHIVFKELDRISKSEWTPLTSQNKQKRWFFERTKGQYMADVKRAGGGETTNARAKKFVKENPKNQLITKTDFAKWYMCWCQHPDVASLGAINCFKKFKPEYLNQISVDIELFHNLVAWDLIDKATATIFKQTEHVGYGNYVRNYVLSILSLKSNGKLDLENIWKTQAVPSALQDIIAKCIEIVFAYLKSQADQGKDPGTEARKPVFWENICTKVVDIKIPSGLLKQEDDNNLTEEQKVILEKVKGYNISTYTSLLNWGQRTRNLTILERKRISRIIRMREREEKISFVVADDIFSLLKKSINLGFRI